jgi:hypothetical protein
VRDDIRIAPPPEGEDPASLSEVVKSGQGTACAKVVLLAHLLGEQGIPARTVCIARNGALQPAWHCLDQFDGFLVRAEIDGRVWWADPASAAPFGQVPSGSYAEKGLLTGAGGGLMELDMPAIPSSKAVATAGRLETDGTLAAKSTVRLAGFPAVATRSAIAVGGAEAWAAQLLREQFGESASLVSATVTSDLDDPDAPLDLALEFRVAEFARRDGHGFHSHLPWLFGVEENPLSAEEREIPVEFDYAGEISEKVKIMVPEGYRLTVAPVGKSARAAQVMYEASHRKSDGTLVSRRSVTIGERVVPTAEYTALRELWSEVAQADTQTFAFGRGGRSSSGTR